MTRTQILVYALGLVPALAAQNHAPADAALVERLLSRLDALERRVAELEGARAAPPAPKAEAPPPATHLHPQALQPAPPGADIQPTYPALKLSGFADFNFTANNQRTARKGFYEGQFILHMSSALSPRVSVFSEVSLSARADAGMGAPPATPFNADVERIIVRFDQSDYFKVSFGRYHTPVNYWNTEFHHGQWLQTSVARPEMTQFGGRFIPVHFVGGLVEGALPAGGMNVNYNVGLGNGRGSVISRAGDDGDNNAHRAWVMNLFSKPDRLFGFQFGGAVYRDKITLPNGRDYREWITSGHLVWKKETPELIAEFANVRHDPVSAGRSTDSQAYYVQLGYRLPWGEKLWKPYYRWEYIHIPQADEVFRGVSSLAGSVLGMRYDLSNFAAVKAEYRNQRRPGLPRIHGAFLQTSFTF
jgi:hypothetical protein